MSGREPQPESKLAGAGFGAMRNPQVLEAAEWPPGLG